MTIAEQQAATKRKRVIRAALVLACVAACAAASLVAAHLLERERGPQAGVLLRQASEAVAEQGHVSFTIRGKAGVEGEARQIEKMIGGSVDLRGYAGPGALSLAGRVGDGEEVELRISGGRLATRLGGRWFVGPAGEAAHLPDAIFNGGLLARKLPEWFAPRSYAAKAAEGRAAWRVDGLPPSGEELESPYPMLDLRSLLGDVSYALWIDRKSRLPLYFEATIDGKPDDWFVVPQTEEGVEAIHAGLVVTFSDWGVPKPVEIPPGAPLEKLESPLKPSSG